MTTYSDEQLEFSSNHLIYHIKMYIKTFLWLRDYPRPADWDTVRNAVLESHLIHARVLIHFVQRESSENDTDVFAVSYFQNQPVFLPLKNEFLKQQAKRIGSQLVHLTTNSSLLKSEQAWQIGEIAISLLPVIQQFLSVVPSHRLSIKINQECKELIDLISSSPSASTSLFSARPST